MALTKLDVSQLSSQAAVQGTSTTAFSTTSTSFQLTNCAASITPTSTARRIKVTLHVMLRNNNPGANNLFYSIDRNGTDLGASGSNGFGRLTNGGGVTTSLDYTHAMTFIDSPASISSLTYTLTIRTDSGTVTISAGTTGTQTMILEEIL